MNNPKYPTFNFCIWLEAYALALHCPKRNNVSDFVRDYAITTEKEELDYNQRCFLSQIHIDDEFEKCPSCEYTRLLLNFNEFLCILHKEPLSKEKLLEHFSKIQTGIPADLIEENLNKLLETLKIQAE